MASNREPVYCDECQPDAEWFCATCDKWVLDVACGSTDFNKSKYQVCCPNGHPVTFGPDDTWEPPNA